MELHTNNSKNQLNVDNYCRRRENFYILSLKSRHYIYIVPRGQLKIIFLLFVFILATVNTQWEIKLNKIADKTVANNWLLI